MRQYLKLSSTLINMNHVVKITNSNNKYHIYMHNTDLNGWMICSSGVVASRDNMIVVCEKEEKKDYDIISKWMTNTQYANKLSRV